MLPGGALLGGVAVVVAAFYYKLWNVQLLKDEAVLLQELEQSYRPAQEPVIWALGRGFFFIAAAAWVVLSLQSLVTGIQRARYKPKVRQPLQPLSEDEARQQQGAQLDTTQQPAQNAPARKASPTTTKAASAQPAQQQSQDWRDEQRRQAIEARQRALEEHAAAVRQQQEQEQAARVARKAQAGAEAAQKKAEREAAEARARAAAEAARASAAAEAERRRDEFVRAARAQWHGMQPPRPVGAGEAGPSGNGPGSGGASPSATGNTADDGASPNATGGGASLTATGNQALYANSTTAAAAYDREVRQQQDLEYQQSLERDRAKAAASAAQRQAAAAALQQQDEQQRLVDLRETLQEWLGPEPPADSDSNPVLTLRVRLPGGSQGSRRFSPTESFEEVFAWVYSLSEMPLWAPGTWTLVSAFPRRQLAPPSGSKWLPGVWQQQQQAGATSVQPVLLPGEWMLQVNRLTEGPVHVLVCDETTVKQLQEEIERQTGLTQDQQRLIYSGQVLQQPQRTLKQLKISPGHTLQLAARGSSAGGSSSSPCSSSAVGPAEAAAMAAQPAAERARVLAKAAEHAYMESGDVLVVLTVAELQQEVAHGASLLALYVEALQSQES